MSDLRVVVIAGGLSPEREVSQKSGAELADVLRRVGVEVDLRDVGADLLPALADDPYAVVFPVLHGAAGEDGTIKEVLELAGNPYVGARPEACRTAFDKTVAKGVLARAGLATPASVTLAEGGVPRSGRGRVDLADGAAAGVAAVREAAGGRLGVRRQSRRCGRAAAGGPDVLLRPPRRGVGGAAGGGHGDRGRRGRPGRRPVRAAGRGDRGGGLYDYAARYTPGAVEFHRPARIPGEVALEAARVAVAAHRALGLRDLSRSDAIVTDAGEVVVLETNVAPGMTLTSTYPMGVAAAGLDFGAFCRDLAALAARRHRHRP